MKENKKTDIWKIFEIINYILTAAYVVIGIIIMSKIGTMKLLPTRYFLAGVVVLLVLPICSGIFRKKKVAIVICIVLSMILCPIMIKGYSMVLKTDETIDKVTQGGDVEITVMEIRVLTDSTVSDENSLKEYKVGVMREKDRKYADEVVADIEEIIGEKLDIKEYEEPGELIAALYAGEVQAIIINVIYGEILSETEEYATLLEDTKVIKEVEIEEYIKEQNKPADNPEQQTQEQPTEENPTAGSGENSGSGGNTGSGGNGYDWYLGHYGDYGGGFVYVEPTNPEEISKDAFVIYISGIDTFGNVNRKCRSDVNILMAVNTRTKKILMVNTPRDYYVPLSVTNGVPDKLTHAGNYGINCSKDTLSMLYGVEVDYYVRMNFTGFIDIINAMGGVDVYSEYAFTSMSHHTYVKGMNYNLDGFKALAFARERKALPGGDNQRGKNQMALLNAMISKLATTNTLFNYNDIMNAIAGSFQTNLTSGEIYSLIHLQLDDMTPWTIESYSVTGTGKMDVTYSIPGINLYVMEPDMSTVYKARDMIKKVITE